MAEPSTCGVLRPKQHAEAKGRAQPGKHKAVRWCPEDRLSSWPAAPCRRCLSLLSCGNTILDGVLWGSLEALTEHQSLRCYHCLPNAATLCRSSCCWYMRATSSLP